MNRDGQWARVKPPGLAMLRRGAWYRVQPSDVPNRVVLGVGNRNVAVHRDLVWLRQESPAGFSVVERSARDNNPTRGTDQFRGDTYAVCPWSRCRVLLRGHPEHLECPDCHHWARVNWDDPC